MRKTAIAVMAVLLLATTAFAAGKIAVDNQVIEFLEVSGKTVVKHNGVDKGDAKKVKKVVLTITLDNGTVVKQRIDKDIFVVYQVNPTCVAYWNLARWVQFCW